MHFLWKTVIKITEIMAKYLYLLLLTLGGLQLPAQGLQNLRFGTDSTLEVMTWNLEHFPKLGLISLDSVEQVVRSVDPDVIAFQEIDNYLYFHALADSLPGWEAFPQGPPYSGLAYLSKASQVQVTSVYEIYDSQSRPFPRPPLVMEMQFQNESYVIIDLHLKCCGDGYIDTNNLWDEESRRVEAMGLLYQYIDNYFSTEKVIVLGDFNDILTDAPANNTMYNFLSDTANYLFADLDIANGSNSEWSFPSWPSHLDHILISNEFFLDYAADSSCTHTISIDNYMPGGFNQYEQIMSDHRPVVLRVESDLWTGLAGPSVKSLLENHPNPFRETTRFSFEPLTDFATMEILNGLGQSVVRKQLKPGDSTCVLKAEGLPSGIYFAKLEMNGELIAVRRLLVSGK